jgi:hypothetical protein
MLHRKSMNTNSATIKPDSNPANRDPISGTPGAHPVGTGAGAAVGGVIGGAAGTVAGPVGTIVGATAGAVAGGLAGKAAGEAVNPTEHETYWRANYTTRPYAREFTSYDDIAPAYRYGWESAGAPAYKGRTFEEAEGILRQDWDHARGSSSATWDKAKSAVKDAWDRVVHGRKG